MNLPTWDEISEHDRRLLETFIDTFTLKDGTQLTKDIFDQGSMLGLEMFMISRMAIDIYLSKLEKADAQS